MVRSSSLSVMTASAFISAVHFTRFAKKCHDVSPNLLLNPVALDQLPLAAGPLWSAGGELAPASVNTIPALGSRAHVFQLMDAALQRDADKSLRLIRAHLELTCTACWLTTRKELWVKRAHSWCRSDE